MYTGGFGAELILILACISFACAVLYVICMMIGRNIENKTLGLRFQTIAKWLVISLVLLWVAFLLTALAILLNAVYIWLGIGIVLFGSAIAARLTYRDHLFKTLLIFGALFVVSSLFTWILTPFTYAS